MLLRSHEIVQKSAGDRERERYIYKEEIELECESVRELEGESEKIPESVRFNALHLPNAIRNYEKLHTTTFEINEWRNSIIITVHLG